MRLAAEPLTHGEEQQRPGGEGASDNMKIVLLAHITVELQERRFLTCYALCKPMRGQPLPEWSWGIGWGVGKWESEKRF